MKQSSWFKMVVVTLVPLATGAVCTCAGRTETRVALGADEKGKVNFGVEVSTDNTECLILQELAKASDKFVTQVAACRTQADSAACIAVSREAYDSVRADVIKVLDKARGKDTAEPAVSKLSSGDRRQLVERSRQIVARYLRGD